MENSEKNRNGGKIVMAVLGILCLLSGVYWIYKDGELLEIIPSFILGIGLIGISIWGLNKKN